MGCHDFIAGLLSVKTFNFVLFSVNFVRFLCLFGKFSKTEQKLLTNLLTCGNIKLIIGFSYFLIVSYSTIIIRVVRNVNLFLFVILYKFLQEFL